MTTSTVARRRPAHRRAPAVGGAPWERPPVDPAGTLDLLDLLAEVTRTPDPPAPLPAPTPAGPHCHCLDRRRDGFTSTTPGLWVHAGCGLPTIEHAATAPTAALAAHAASAPSGPVAAPAPPEPLQAPAPPVSAPPPWDVPGQPEPVVTTPGATRAAPTVPSAQRPEWPPRRPQQPQRPPLRLRGNPAAETYCRISRWDSPIITDGALTGRRAHQLRADGWVIEPWRDGLMPSATPAHNPFTSD